MYEHMGKGTGRTSARETRAVLCLKKKSAHILQRARQFGRKAESKMTQHNTWGIAILCNDTVPPPQRDMHSRPPFWDDLSLRPHTFTYIRNGKSGASLRERESVPTERTHTYTARGWKLGYPPPTPARKLLALQSNANGFLWPHSHTRIADAGESTLHALVGVNL